MNERPPLPIATADGTSVAELSRRCRALEAANRSLVDEVAQLRRDRDELRTYLATLAHDLRNPLAPVRNAVHLLRLRTSDASKVDSAARLIDRQVACMSRVIDHLLASGRVDVGGEGLQALKNLLDTGAGASKSTSTTAAAHATPGAARPRGTAMPDAQPDLRIRLRELAAARQSARVHAHHDAI